MDKNEKSYQVIKEGDRYTIGQFDDGYEAYIINDGICNYYFWETEEEAQEAANAYNSFDGLEWLDEHGNGNDTLDVSEIEDADPDLVDLYRMFNAIVG